MGLIVDRENKVDDREALLYVHPTLQGQDRLSPVGLSSERTLETVSLKGTRVTGEKNPEARSREES